MLPGPDTVRFGSGACGTVVVVVRHGVVVDGTWVITRDVVFELVAGDKAQLAVRTLVHVCHAHQCRAATFPADDNPVTNSDQQPRGRAACCPRKGRTTQWESATDE